MIDLNYTTSSTTLHTDLDLVLQQLDMFLNTDKKEVLGDPDYGNDYDTLLYEMDYTNTQIERYIYSTITSAIDLMGFEMGVHVTLCQGTERDIMLVEIDLRRDDIDYAYTFKIS